MHTPLKQWRYGYGMGDIWEYGQRRHGERSNLFFFPFTASAAE